MERPLVAQKGAYAVDVEAGKTYVWCRCGRSKSQPFCDGAHKGSPFRPLTYVARSTTKIFFCGCKETSVAPLCDGTHSRLDPADDRRGGRYHGL